MSTQEWPANDYAIGSYIQATIAEQYLRLLNPSQNSRVLDLGCGDGKFTKKILDKLPNGSVLGIDGSDNMLQLASEVARTYPNFSLQKADVLGINYKDAFDAIVSFWCLQWVRDMPKAMENIYNALKPDGKVLLLFPAGDDPYILGYYALKESGAFPVLSNFVPPVDYTRFTNLGNQLKQIPFKELEINRYTHSLVLPSLDTYEKFVKGIAFYQGQVPASEIEAINAALVKRFNEECQKKYQGEFVFELSIYLVTGRK